MSGRYTAPKVTAIVGPVGMRAAYPGLIAKYDRCVEALDLLPVQTCPHLMDVATVAIACSDHPAGGVRCYRCAEDHIAHHSDDLEHTCDQCGRVGPLARTVAMRTIADGVPTHDLNGVDGTLHGTVVVAGLGVCARCMRRGGHR